MLLAGRALLGCAGLSGCAADLGSVATGAYKSVVPAPQTVAPIVQRPPATVAASSNAAPKGASVTGSNSAGWTGKDKDVVISADKSRDGNVNCPGGNQAQCRVAGSNTGKNYNNGANGAPGNNGNGAYEVVNKNDCNPSTHYACCFYKNTYSTDEYCKGTSQCCTKH